MDGATFQKLGDIYFRDARSVWGLSFGSTTKWVKIPLADPATFVSTGRFEGQDKDHVFKETTVVKPPAP